MLNQVIGSFRIDRELGVGGMGVVYLATHLDSGRHVALKVLSEDRVQSTQVGQRFEREVSILKKLRHKNVVRYYGGGVYDGQRYCVMEVLDGGTLEDFLNQRNRRLTWEQAVDVGTQVCAALQHAHQHDVIHRDLKPGNLFLNQRGQLKLGDFGIARDTTMEGMTLAGRTVGTYAYMAPEQIEGSPPVSGKTDLYALGCVLYEVLTGRTPFLAETPAEMLIRHVQDQPRPVSELAADCPGRLQQVIDKLLAKAPADRYDDAVAVLLELQQIPGKVTSP